MPTRVRLMTTGEAIKKYIINVLIALDQLANALLGGDPDETISSRAGRMLKLKNKPLWARILCWFLDFIDPNHCIDAVEKEEGKDEVIHLF